MLAPLILLFGTTQLLLQTTQRHCLTGLEEEHRNLTKVEVDEVLGLVGDVGAWQMGAE